eukprot:8523307-Alexandrium_andersonii.AAC.1
MRAAQLLLSLATATPGPPGVAPREDPSRLTAALAVELGRAGLGSYGGVALARAAAVLARARARSAGPLERAGP